MSSSSILCSSFYMWRPGCAAGLLMSVMVRLLSITVAVMVNSSAVLLAPEMDHSFRIAVSCNEAFYLTGILQPSSGICFSAGRSTAFARC